ncbi:MAG TPA: hypothetical protein VLH86_01175 [Patescibacteria group bacterium]|nr:hypothetical protein [Patescibacteria group bacterium]
MTLARAALYHLFAGRNSGRAARLRIVLFSVGLCLVAALTYKLTPQTVFGYDITAVFSLLFVLTFLFTTSLYIFTAGAQRVFLRRLEVVNQLPLRRVQIRYLLALAYAPVTLLGCAVIVPAACSVFRGRLGAVATIFSALVCFTLVATSTILARTTEFRFNKYVQPAGLVSLFLGLLLAWKMAASGGPDYVLQGLVLGIVFFHVGLVVFLLRCRPKMNYSSVSRPVREYMRLGISTALILRALRTGRYRGANFTLAATFFGLACVARASPTLLFDPVVAITILLVGTFGQEARSISKCRYTIEQVRYGLFNRWLIASWALAFLNAVAWLATIYGTSALLGLDINIGFIQAACVCIGLVSTAIMAASLVVPQKNDMLAQIGGAAIYSALAWCVFRTIGHTQRNEQMLITISLIVICLSASYVWERTRWATTVRKE